MLALLESTSSGEERFLAAKLLTSWGFFKGLTILEKTIETPECLEGLYCHPLHGYDDTYRQILLAIIQYFANVADRGEVEAARAAIYSPLSKIIRLANSRPFDISNLLDFLKKKKYLEFVPLIEEHIVAILDHPHLHGWKIHEAIEFLMEFSPCFMLSLLGRKKYLSIVLSL